MSMNTLKPVIQQTECISGKSIKLRNVTPEDAEFIISLRTDQKKCKFLSKTSNDIQKQRKWIEEYLNSEGQAYFIITDSDHHSFGTIRMYDQQQNSFCWGSWILTENAPSHYAIESALLIYLYALHLGFDKSHFDVRKGNYSVIKFHERCGAIRTGETEQDILYSISKDKIHAALDKFKKYLPEIVDFR